MSLEVLLSESPWQCPVRWGMGPGLMVSSSIVRGLRSCYETWWWSGQRQKLHDKILLWEVRQDKWSVGTFICVFLRF